MGDISISVVGSILATINLMSDFHPIIPGPGICYSERADKLLATSFPLFAEAIKQALIGLK